MADFSIDASVIGPVTSDVTADVTSTLTGLDNVKLTLAGDNTLHSDATITLEPVTTTSTTTSSLDSTARVDTNSQLDSTSRVDTASAIDLRPVAVDSCLRLELAPPPATEVCTPYEQQWSWSILGLELFAITVRGSTSTHIRPEHQGPLVIDL